MTHATSQAVAGRALPSERRARLRPWVRFADSADIVGGVYEGTRLCTVCNRLIGEGELDYLVVLAGAVALRVDQECLNLWREAVATDLHCESPSADGNYRDAVPEEIVLRR